MQFQLYFNDMRLLGTSYIHINNCLQSENTMI